MSSNQDIFIDPWMKHWDDFEAVPDDAVFLCSFDLDVAIDFVAESAYIRHTETRSELWIENEFGRGIVVAVPKPSSAEVPAAVLMDHRIRSLAGFARPASFHEAGLLTEAEFTAIIDAIKAEREGNRKAAQESRTEIINVAEELGLHPRPTGGGADQWAADCPGTKHHLFIVSSTSSFGCGYCRRKGGPDELRAFVEDRRKRNEEQSSRT